MEVLHGVRRTADRKAADGDRDIAHLGGLHHHRDEPLHGRAGWAVVTLDHGNFAVDSVGVLGQVVGSDDEELAPVCHEIFCRQAGRRNAQHHAEGGTFIEGNAALTQVLLAVGDQTHRGIPVLHIRHHREHDPQRPTRRGTEQGADLGLELMGPEQAAPDAAQTQFGGLQPLERIGNGAVCTKVEGTHGHRVAVGGGKTGRIEHILFLFVQRVAGHHHVTAAEQANALRARLHGRRDILGAEAVRQQFELLIVLRPAGQLTEGVQFLILSLQLADARDGLLTGHSIGVKDALALGRVQNDSAAVAVREEVFSHLHDARDLHRARDDGRMALSVSLGSDNAQNHPGRHTEQVTGHQNVGRDDNRMVEGQPDSRPVAEDIDDPAGGVEDVDAS